MQAVFKLTGHQYSATEGDIVRVGRIDSEEGSKFDIEEVLLLQKGEDSIIGTPNVPDAKIEAEIVAHGLDDKIRVYKYKRRTKYRLTQGHRQGYSDIKINKIIVPVGQE